MQMTLDILRGLSCYVLLVVVGGLIFWLTIPGFAGPVSPEIKLRAMTAVMGGGALFVAIIIFGFLVAVNRS